MSPPVVDTPGLPGVIYLPEEVFLPENADAGLPTHVTCFALEHMECCGKQYEDAGMIAWVRASYYREIQAEGQRLHAQSIDTTAAEVRAMLNEHREKAAMYERLHEASKALCELYRTTSMRALARIAELESENKQLRQTLGVK